MMYPTSAIGGWSWSDGQGGPQPPGYTPRRRGSYIAIRHSDQFARAAVILLSLLVL